ncbi:putative O-methyltransferase [Xylogone sp. PMI_703]|nr:putative O-methyltransferase [Xylogone sp. PMI_703]
MASTHQKSLVVVAEDILGRVSDLSEQLSQRSWLPPKGLGVGATSELWTTHDRAIEASRSTILTLMQQLELLLEGPHEFLHRYVSANWEYGALYTLLEFDVLEKLPLDGTAVTADLLAEQVGISSEKLLRICRLVACVGILQEKEEGSFAHTAISEMLVRDEGYKSFIRFQLFETRIASANLSDSLWRPNPYWTGQSAFKYAFGMPMYDWHAKHPEKGKRFAQAMGSVSQGLDPGNSMIIDWLANQQKSNGKGAKPLIVEVAGKTGAFSCQLANIFPDLSFEVQDSSPELLRRGEQSVSPEIAAHVRFHQADLFVKPSIQRDDSEGGRGPVIFLLRGVLWNLADNDVVKLLQNFALVMKDRKGVSLLVNDLVSPTWGTFEPNIERAYRRRDVTLMTMHNVKQRTASEWDTLIRSADPDFKVVYSERYSSHSCRGMWCIEFLA